MKQNRKIISSFLVATLMITTSIVVLADWNPGDGHKMHYPQLPDETGWDVYATSGLPGVQEICLADDFQCTESGPITDIHFWGSWKDGIEGTILGFNIAIHADIPADPPSIPYSRPGSLLWEQYFTVWDTVMITSTDLEGWYNPYTGEVLYDNHDEYFQYNIIDIINPFIQVEGTIYWLRISAVVQEDPTGPQPLWGWKSSIDHWNDDACWAEPDLLDWVDLWEPAETITNDWFVAFDMAGMPIPPLTGGSDPFPGGINGWYDYPSGWWNIWFYDHPLDYDRMKLIETWFTVQVYEMIEPGYIEIAVNYATDLWSIEGTPGEPPLPGVDESLYIERVTIYDGIIFEPMPFYFPYEILDYNPEWVSIDVRGNNFIIEDGIIEHSCLESMDLAFVITGGGQPGPEVEYSKTVWNETLGDWDEYIEAEICTTARFNLSIYNNDNNPFIVTKIWDTLPPCLEYDDSATVNGIPLEPDVVALPTIEWNYPIPADYWYPGSAPGELPPGEWIFIEFDVHVIGPPCTDNINWGYWDVYYDEEYYFFEDNATIHPFEEPWPDCKMHFPQLPDPTGWDVFALYPENILADDFLCNESGAITDLHFWGSWWYDEMPYPEGRPDGFHISFHADIPDPDGEGPLYSMPGELLWERDIFIFETIPEEPSWQGWFEPPEYYEEMNHQQYFRYDIFFDPPYFFQNEGTIYWVDIAPIHEPVFFWGWKTSLDHWNDDAVYWYESTGEWMELHDPLEGISLDMAFVITGEEIPDAPPTACYTWSDADGSGTGTTIDFDASCSTDDYGITTYEWDWTNDGSYDYTGGPTASHDYGDTSSHDCTLRVTDTIGQTDTFTDTVQAIVEIEDVNQSVQDRGFPIRHAIDGDWAGAQNFSTSVSTLTQVKIYLRKFGAPDFNLTVELREGSPTGTLLDTKVFVPSLVPSSWAWFSVDFVDTAVTSSGDYFVVCPPAPSGITTSFGYEWGYAFGDQYWPGSFWFTRDGGGLWRDLPTMYEFVFSTFGY